MQCEMVLNESCKDNSGETVKRRGIIIIIIIIF